MRMIHFWWPMTAVRRWRQFDIGRHANREPEMEMQPLGQREVIEPVEQIAVESAITAPATATAMAATTPEAEVRPTTTTAILTRASIWNLSGRRATAAVVNVVVSVNADVHCDASTAL